MSISGFHTFFYEIKCSYVPETSQINQFVFSILGNYAIFYLNEFLGQLLSSSDFYKYIIIRDKYLFLISMVTKSQTQASDPFLFIYLVNNTKILNNKNN